MRRLAESSLWLGHVGDARDPRSLYEAGIVAVVDLALNEPPTLPPRDLVYCRFPLLDGSGNPPALLRLAVSTVATFLRDETPTLVFCSAGLSRTPAIVAAALASVRGLSLDVALAIVARDRPADVSPGLYRELAATLADSHAR